MGTQAQTNDEQLIEALYKQMYRAMVEKDTVTLNQVHAASHIKTYYEPTFVEQERAKVVSFLTST